MQELEQGYDKKARHDQKVGRWVPPNRVIEKPDMACVTSVEELKLKRPDLSRALYASPNGYAVG